MCALTFPLHPVCTGIAQAVLAESISTAIISANNSVVIFRAAANTSAVSGSIQVIALSGAVFTATQTWYVKHTCCAVVFG